MQAMLGRIYRASKWASLSFSPRKCASLSLERSYRSRQRVKNQPFHLGETVVPVIAWEDRYKYLGVKAGANSTPDMAKQGDDFIKDVEVITRSDLTDWQKLDAIHRFAKPRLVYSMQNQLPSLGWARSLDVKVRSLPRRTTDAFLYSPWRAGGLGLPRIEDEVHIYGVSTTYHLLSLNKDPIVSVVALNALSATARKRSQGTLSPQDFCNSPPQRGEGRPGNIRSLWSRVRVSIQLYQANINLTSKGDQSGRQSVWP